MTVTFTIYHNPRCSKSRQTLALLEEHNITPTVIEYLKQPPDADTLAHLLDLLGKTPRELIRSKEAEYAEAGLDQGDRSDAELLAAMVAHPKLIERPIVVRDDGREQAAVLGRPPENVLVLI